MEKPPEQNFPNPKLEEVINFLTTEKDRLQKVLEDLLEDVQEIQQILEDFEQTQADDLVQQGVLEEDVENLRAARVEQISIVSQQVSLLKRILTLLSQKDIEQAHMLLEEMLIQARKRESEMEAGTFSEWFDDLLVWADQLAGLYKKG